MTWRESSDFGKETGELLRLVRGLIRRMRVTLTTGARWQLLGQRGGAGGDETIDVEAFTGIGVYARPPSSGNPEAITAAVGGARTPVIVATRDEATRRAVAGDLAEGETAVYNDKAIVVIKADGTVEIRLVGGVAVPLATKADLDVLRTAISSAAIALGAGGAADIVAKADLALAPKPWPVGTTVLKAQ
jgi:phage gp45-like